MTEIYQIRIRSGHIDFEPREMELPCEILDGKNVDSIWSVFCRLGDPAILECICWQKEGSNEAIFHMKSEGRTCFVACAGSGLEFAEALGHFGNMCANVRYAEDIFQESGDEND